MMLLTAPQIEVELAGLKNWTCDGKMLSKTFSFQHFDQSVAFFFFLASIANEINHHPDFFNSYKRCKVQLSTHDKAGLTELDFIFAQKIDEAYD
jgi:4a-hydroxytetrahydrobiopterin dehydratase